MLPDLLTRAIWQGNVALVRDLLSRGADLDGVDSRGWTPLMQAAESEDLTIIALLLRSGADPNHHGNEGMTPLHVAVDIAIDGTIQENGHAGEEPIHVINFLLAAGADVNATNNSGHTPFDLAQQYGSERIMATLLGHT